MANEKILNTRIRLKYDSLQNWTDKNTVLLQGEVAIAYLADSHTTTTPDNGTHPVLMKVGPGAFNSLPWMSALAADVYAWAKATEAEHIEWLKTNHADNNTTYAFAIVNGALQVTETPHVNGVAGTPVVKSYDFITPDELTTILNNYYTKTEVNAITGDLANLNTTNKGNLVAAINEALQAVEVGGTGSVVTVADSSFESNDSDKTYTGSIRFDVKQGGNKVSVPIEFGAGAGLEVTPVAHPSGESTNIPAIGLSDATKTSLEKADTAVQSVTLESGTSNGTLKLTVDGTATGDILVKGLQDAAYVTVESLNATAQGYANGKDAAIQAAQKAGDDAAAALNTYKGEMTTALANKADKSVVDAMYTNSKIDELLATKQNTIPAETYDSFGSAADALEEAKDYADQKLLDFENAYIKADENGTIDKLNEIAAWIADDEAGAAKIISDVAAANTNASNAVSTANAASGVASEAKGLAEGAVNTANDAKTAALTAQNSASASASAADASAQAAAGSAGAAASAQALAEGHADTASTKASEASASAGAAAGSASEAATAKQGAEAAQSAAETAQSAAEAAQLAAERAQAAAEDAKLNAQENASVASNASGAAAEHSAAAVTARQGAETAQGKAEAAQAAAEAAQAAAESSNTSATAIANEAKGAAEAATAASNAATQAVAGLHAIATSGSTDDLVAGTEVWVFNCGGAE